ncbi:MAG: hypothetical protein ABFE13_10955 [Phycisphaerales bacterium]
MRLSRLFSDAPLYDLLETALPDFVLAFAFFTSVAYAVLGKKFDLQRPAVAMSAAIGLALSMGLIWWEQKTGFSVKNLGPIAVGFAIILLALVMYQSIRGVGGSWAGAGIALGASILVAKLLEVTFPVAADIVQTVVTVALVVGMVAFLVHRGGRYARSQEQEPVLAGIRHDMSDLYRDRRLSRRLARGLRRVRRKAATLNEHPDQAVEILGQLRKILPAEGWLTQQMAQLRAKAHRIRHGHIARLQETRDIFAKLPASAKKEAAANLADRYNQVIGMDTRLERLDKAVAETERRIRDLTAQAQQYAAQRDQPRLQDTLRTAERLQRHNSRLVRIIKHTEGKLSALVQDVADQAKRVTPK